MRTSKIVGISLATLFTVTSSALAQTAATQTPAQNPNPQSQTPMQTPAQSQMQTNKSDDTTPTQTFTGCLMTEPDYRRAHNLGGGALGGVGLGDEFVLVGVKVSPATMAGSTGPGTSSSMANSSRMSTTAAGTCSDNGVAYRLTGTAEEKIKGMVGHQLEIQGRFKHADSAANTSQATDKLPAEVEIVSFRDAPAAVTAMMPESVAPQASTPTMTAPVATPSTPSMPPTSSMTPTTTPDVSPAPGARRELPRTASSSALIALVGVLALSLAVAFGIVRRRTV